jgi:YHS domain-containing protein
VSGDKLGEMGDPYVYEYKGREIKFCCKGCLKDFNKEPEKYIKKIEEAEAKAKKAKS